MKYFVSLPERLKTSLVNRLVKYQPDGVEYKIVNVIFDVDVYNLAVNFRVFSRLSVSMMVTIALEQFLDEVLKEFEGTGKSQHNYIEYLHKMGHNTASKSSYWGVLWKIGPKTQTKPQITT